MTKERQDITEDYYAGNHKNIRDTVYDKDDALFDLTGAEATFFLSNQQTGEIYITKSSFSATEIEILDQVTNKGELVVYLIPGDTLRANADDLYGTFRYQIHCVDQNGNEATVTTGRMDIFASPGTGRARKMTISAYLEGQPVP